MSTSINRQWLLAARPAGLVKASDFRFVETPVPEPGEGEILVRSDHVSIDPAMRGWMENRADYVAPLAIGAVMRSFNTGTVVASRHPGFAPGDAVGGAFGVQDYCLAGTAAVPARKLRRPHRKSLYLSLYGVTGMTAYFGLLEIGALQEGETVLVSGAAGAVGSIAGQIAKVKGCRVVGIAGGAEKCRALTERFGFDAAIDYKAGNLAARLKETCPQGIDVYFDNVGGEILDLALARLANRARVVLCGGISRYNLAELPPGPKNYFNLVFRRARMEGFIVLDYADRFDAAEDVLAEWADSGKLRQEEHVVEGLELFPQALIGLFQGENIGKQVLRVDVP